MSWGRGVARSKRASQTRNRFDQQNRNLLMHFPMTDANTPKPAAGGWPGCFKDTMGQYKITVFDPNNIGYSPLDHEIGMRTVAGTGQYGANNACNYRVVYHEQIAGYNGSTKNYITPTRFTVMMWFKLYGWSSGTNHLMGDIQPGASSWLYNWVVRVQNTGVIRYLCQDGSAGHSSEVVSGSSEVALNKIYLATMTYDGQQIKGYLNNRLIGTTGHTYGIGNGQGCLEIASNQQDLFTVLGINGAWWDFRMYSAALSKAQITDIYYNYWKLYGKDYHPAYTVAGADYLKTIVQGMTFSDSASSKTNRFKSITQTVTPTQTIATNRGNVVTVTQSFTASQSFGRAYLKTVTQNVTAAQDLSFLRSKHYTKLVSQSFAAYQDVGKRIGKHITLVQSFVASDNPQNDLTNIRQSFHVTQVIAFNRMLNQRISQSFATESVPFVNSPRLLDISQGFAVAQDSSGRNSTNRQSLTQSVVTSQTAAGRNSVFRFVISQSFATGYTLYRRDAIIRQTITHAFATTHRVNTHWFKRVEQDINIVDIIDAHRHVYRTFHTDTVIDHTFDKQRVVNRTVGTTLEESSTFNRQVIYGRTVDTPLVVEQSIVVSMQLSAPQIYLPEIVGGPPQFGLPNVVRPGISGIVPIANLVKLDSGTSIILLPVPQLQNTLGDAAEVVVKRSISGNAQAYKKTTGQQRFTYTFWLDMIKALELRDWVIANGSKKITLTNWRGEAWQGNITTDQPQFTYDGLRQGDALEKVTITLSFQGVKLYG